MNLSATSEIPGIKVTTTRNTGKITLSGQITLKKAQEIREELVSLLNDKRKVTVDVSRIDMVDSSILQLLCASRRRARSSGRDFTIKCREGCAFLIQAVESGFHKAEQCSVSDSGNLLWDMTSCSDKGV